MLLRAGRHLLILNLLYFCGVSGGGGGNQIFDPNAREAGGSLKFETNQEYIHGKTLCPSLSP